MLPVHSAARPVGSIPYALSVLLVLDAIVATVATLAWPDLLHGPAAMVGSMQGTAVVVLVVAMPVLVASMVVVRRGSVLAYVGWLGTLAFVAYQGVLFLFGTPFNGLFFFYLGMLSLGVWALIALVPQIPVHDIGARFGPRAPVRLVAAYLLTIAAAFWLLWLKAIVPALFDSEAPPFLAGTGMLTGPGQIIDLGFALPLVAATAVWVWQRRVWGHLLAGALLVMLALESLSIAADQWLGSAADPGSTAVSAAMAPVFVGITVVGLVVLGAYLRAAQAGDRSPSIPLPGPAL